MEERLYELLQLAVRLNATDIHFTHRFSRLKIIFRINGNLQETETKHDDEKLLRYLQYLAGLDVGDLSKPQTGQFEMHVEGRLLSCRFAVINSREFTDGVLRILNSELSIKADELSSLKSQNDYFKELLRKRGGLVLLSGPTGSGKSTTLYTLLKEVKDRVIYTIEDPVEIRCDSLVQLEVNEALGFDYAEGIRQILRHDPDIIMIGEIRDEKAAKMAIRAANTGHLVLSTIHANRASGCINRMVELGGDEDYLYEVLRCLSSQLLLYRGDGSRKVIYEIMDEREIAYYREHHRNSPSFLSLETQYTKAGEDGYF